MTRQTKNVLGVAGMMGGAALAWLAIPGAAFAQDPAPAAAATTEAPAPVVEAPVVMALPPAPPPPAAPAMDDGTAAPLEAHAWGRIGTKIQGSKDPKKLNDVSQNAELNLLFSGRIHKLVGWQADLVATYPGTDAAGKPSHSSPVEILDLIGKLELDDAFNIWVGRMLVASDRSNFSGPWFMAPWNYPSGGPMQGPSGRNEGATVWGQFKGGMLKYYVGAFDMHNVGESPLYTMRLNLSLINPEPGYYHSSTYYGKDIFAVGLSGQYKKNGSLDKAAVAAPDDYSGFSADVLFEKDLKTSGVFDAEGAFYKYNGDNESAKHSFFVLASFLLPNEIGVGKLQPLVRFHGASPKGGGDMATTIDAQVGYVIKDYAARLAVGFQHSKMGAAKSNQIFLGLQLMK